MQRRGFLKSLLAATGMTALATKGAAKAVILTKKAHEWLTEDMLGPNWPGPVEIGVKDTDEISRLKHRVSTVHTGMIRSVGERRIVRLGDVSLDISNKAPVIFTIWRECWNIRIELKSKHSLFFCGYTYAGQKWGVRGHSYDGATGMHGAVADTGDDQGDSPLILKQRAPGLPAMLIEEPGYDEKLLQATIEVEQAQFKRNMESAFAQNVPEGGGAVTWPTK